MNKSHLKFENIDAYHAAFPERLQKILNQLRHIIKEAAPEAEETISYGMPAFRQNKVIVYYAAHNKHIGFYPTPLPIIHFKKELEKYKTSKGAIQFPIELSLPLDLIKKMVEFRLSQMDKN